MFLNDLAQYEEDGIVQGVPKKIAHFYAAPISNGNNSELVCPIWLKIYVLRAPYGES